MNILQFEADQWEIKQSSISGRIRGDTLSRVLVHTDRLPDNGDECCTMRLKDRAIWRDLRSILVVDDEVTLLWRMVNRLKEEGFRVSVAISVETAIEGFIKKPTDLAVIDIVLGPGENDSGIVVTREIKKLSPKTRILVISARPSVYASTMAMRCGADNYIVKTGNFAFLLDTAFDPPSTTLPEQLADELPRRTLDEIEQHALEETLKECGGNRTEAARRLGIARTTVQDLLKKGSR